jgi:prevent-host-death family protein
MASVGVRDLRQRASELLRRVAAGETIEITDRGRPVAILAPLPEAGPLERLRAAGDTSVPSGSLDDLPDPLPVPPGHEPASAILARLRRDER